jgi:hypothetical protein
VIRVAVSWTLGVVTLGVFAVGTGEPAAACECAVFSDLETVANADAIFTATLVETSNPSEWDDPKRFLFEVDEVFKGDVSAHQPVVSASSGASCGLEITGPGPFLVFARTESDGITRGALEGELYSNLCSGTQAVANGALPINLAAGSPPKPGPAAFGPNGDQSNGGPRTPAAVWIAITGVVVVLAGGGLMAHRRFGRSR